MYFYFRYSHRPLVNKNEKTILLTKCNWFDKTTKTSNSSNFVDRVWADEVGPGVPGPSPKALSAGSRPQSSAEVSSTTPQGVPERNWMVLLLGVHFGQANGRCKRNKTTCSSLIRDEGTAKEEDVMTTEKFSNKKTPKHTTFLKELIYTAKRMAK